MNVHAYGPHAALVDVEPGHAAEVAAAVRAAPIDGVVEVVPGAASVLVVCRDGVARDEVMALTLTPSDGRSAPPHGVVEVPVTYDGPDLAAVAASVGMSVDAVVALHSGTEHRVAFCGFAPGFAYLDGLPAALHLPRRDTPRTRVPPGSVAIASTYSAVYPSASPGGWHLLGRTDIALWDDRADPPALLTPGTVVRFVPR